MFGMTRDERRKLDEAYDKSMQSLMIIEGHVKSCDARAERQEIASANYRKDMAQAVHQVDSKIDGVSDKMSDQARRFNQVFLSITGAIILGLISIVLWFVAPVFQAHPTVVYMQQGPDAQQHGETPTAPKLRGK